MTNKTWTVTASICDCNKVAITVMEGYFAPEEDSENLEETGPDWRPLVDRLARALHDETGLHVSAPCSTAVTKDSGQRQALSDELSFAVYKVADSLAGSSR